MTGAGDLYAAGFLYGLTQGLPLAACGRLGSLAAAEVIGHIGARPETSLRKLAQERGLHRRLSGLWLFRHAQPKIPPLSLMGLTPLTAARLLLCPHTESTGGSMRKPLRLLPLS